ncbi:MAG: hypothetical protein K0R14_1045 [Burkholderiales bacterium]|nr:hypothetical protein [Burkholderiales bacterium]
MLSLSSRGLGHRPFTAVTGVRIPLGTPLIVDHTTISFLNSGLLAQPVEQLAFNQLVTSSNLVQPTTSTSKISMIIKKSICVISIAVSTYVYAGGTSTNLISVQNNYQSAKADYNNKEDILTQSTNDVTTAKNNLEKAQKNLQQAQRDLKDAQTDLQQKNALLVRAKQDVAVSEQNLKTAANAVNQAWKK